MVQGVPRGAGGTGPPSAGTAAAEGSHPPQHVGDVDGVELGHITGVTPALERRSASSGAGWGMEGGGEEGDAAVPIPVPPLTASRYRVRWKAHVKLVVAFFSTT